jgi:hypothetical protein
VSVSRPSSVAALVGYFLLGYLVVNAANTAVTLVYTGIARTTAPEALGVSFLYDPAYQATVPWHVLINFVIWAGVGALYAGRRRAGQDPAPVRAGLLWLAATVVLDFVVYVAILGSTRWGLPFDEYYVGNQPWITLTYVGIPLGVLAGARIVRALAARRQPA